MESKYSLDWFKARALESLRPIGPGSWDYSDSLLLYPLSAEKEYENIQKEGDPYYDLVTEPETRYISEIADKIAAELPDNFYYIDLGPGTEHKERFIFDALKRQKKNFTYFPIDISSYFLDSAKEFAERNNIKTVPVKSSFEECYELLPDDSIYRFVSLGATFANYHTQEIFSLLIRIIGKNGSAFINAHIRERVDLEKVKGTYARQAIALGMPKLNLIDLSQEDIENIEVNDKVEDWCTVKNPSKILLAKGVKRGDKLLVFQSLRYSLDKLLAEIQKTFQEYSVFDTGKPFIAFLLKK